MSKLAVDEITDSSGAGAPDFPHGLTVNGGPVAPQVPDPTDPNGTTAGTVTGEDLKNAVEEFAPDAEVTTEAVLEATAGATAGGVGTYMFARRTTGTGNVSFGSTLGGSSLSPISALGGSNFSDSSLLPVGSSQSGTWRCMGNYWHNFNSNLSVTLWLRIS